MIKALKRSLGGLYMLALVPVLVFIVLSPLFAILIGIQYFAGSGGSLDEDCKIRTIQSHTIAFFAPKRFWTEQVKYLDEQLQSIESQPARMRAEQERMLRKLAETTAQLERERPELFANQRSSAQQAADALRAKADEIEYAELAKAAEAERLQRIARAQYCRSVAIAKLASL